MKYTAPYVAIKYFVAFHLLIWHYWHVSTQWGEAKVVTGSLGGVDVVLLARHLFILSFTSFSIFICFCFQTEMICYFCKTARHGTSHSVPPGEVNYRANIWALRLRYHQGDFSITEPLMQRTGSDPCACHHCMWLTSRGNHSWPLPASIFFHR